MPERFPPGKPSIHRMEPCGRAVMWGTVTKPAPAAHDPIRGLSIAAGICFGRFSGPRHVAARGRSRAEGLSRHCDARGPRFRPDFSPVASGITGRKGAGSMFCGRPSRRKRRTAAHSSAVSFSEPPLRSLSTLTLWPHARFESNARRKYLTCRGQALCCATEGARPGAVYRAFSCRSPGQFPRRRAFLLRDGDGNAGT